MQSLLKALGQLQVIVMLLSTWLRLAPQSFGCSVIPDRAVMACTDYTEHIEASFQYFAGEAQQAFKAVTVPSPEFTTHKVMPAAFAHIEICVQAHFECLHMTTGCILMSYADCILMSCACCMLISYACRRAWLETELERRK